MPALPTDRTGWLVLATAAANFACHSIVLCLVLSSPNRPALILELVDRWAISGPVWPHLVYAQLPAAVILTAAIFSLRGHPAARVLILAAVLVASVGQLCFLDAKLGGPVSQAVGTKAVSSVYQSVSVPPRSYLLAGTAVVAAAAGWWFRHDPEADTDA